MKLRQLVGATFAIVAMLTTTVSLAHPPGDPAKHLARMTEVLGLFDDQIPQVQAILEESHAQLEQIRGTYTLNQRDEAHAAMQAVREDTHKRLAEVLTAEQIERLDAHHAKMRKRADRHHGKKMKHGEPTYD